MNAGDALQIIRAQLPEDIQQALANVSFEMRPGPTKLDYQRGATADHMAYYFGETRQLSTGTELPDESSPPGVIVIFVGNIRPLTVTRFTEVVLHEIAHVLGVEEDEIVFGLELAP